MVKKPGGRQPYHFDQFMRGLQTLASWDRVDFMATDHGPVLKGGIVQFFAE